MSKRYITAAGDSVLICIPEDLYEPKRARRFARQLIDAAHRAEYIATQMERVQRTPEAAVVEEAEDDDDLCPSCPDYAGKCEEGE